MFLDSRVGSLAGYLQWKKASGAGVRTGLHWLHQPGVRLVRFSLFVLKFGTNAFVLVCSF